MTGEAPLIDTTQSSVSSNIDPRQMSELPVQGREWTTLALLAPGDRTNAIGDTPVQDRGDVREFQFNMDGQQVTNMLRPGGQPRFSRDAIAEFQFISNRFDATQGAGSSGVQDVRFQERIPLAGRVRIDGILELFNLFDLANYGSFVTDRSSPRYGLPNASSNLAYASRTGQTGFRLTF